MHDVSSLCTYCGVFEWGRPYRLREHLEEEHPDVDVEAALEEAIRTRRRVTSLTSHCGVRRDPSEALPSEFGDRKDKGERSEIGLATPKNNERVEREAQKRDDVMIHGDAQMIANERGHGTPNDGLLGFQDALLRGGQSGRREVEREKERKEHAMENIEYSGRPPTEWLDPYLLDKSHWPTSTSLNSENSYEAAQHSQTLTG
jgi:hypothetical protein